MNSRWTVVTETETNLPNDSIPFVLTPADRTKVAIVQCDIEAMRRRFREPDGLTVSEATQSEWDKAREAFRRNHG